MSKTKQWPFENDADRNDPLTEHRIAVTSSHPMWCYLVAFHADSPARPDERETAVLASYLEHYKQHWYNPTYLAKLARLDLDVDGGANGVIFHKWATDDWGYRRQSYEYGHLFSVTPPRWRGTEHDDGIPGPLALVPLLDRMETCGGDQPIQHWQEWKAAHPEVFG